MIVLRVLGWLWALPLTLLGTLRLFVYWPTAVRWIDGVIEVDCKRIVPAFALGQTVGMLTCYSPALIAVGNPARLRRHEQRHAWGQFAVFGVAMLPLYLIAMVVAALRDRDWYHENYFEEDARAHEVPHAP